MRVFDVHRERMPDGSTRPVGRLDDPCDPMAYDAPRRPVAPAHGVSGWLWAVVAVSVALAAAWLAS